MNRTVAKLTESLGYEIVPKWRLNDLAQARYMQQLFGLLEIDCVLDVGANAGQFYEFLRKHVGYKGWVVSFEPLPDAVELLRRHAAEDPMWRIESYALGREAGVGTFNIMASSTFSSFLTPTHKEVTRFSELNAITRTVDVEIRTLDEVLPKIEEELRPNGLYLKMDTQGFDLEIVRGARDRIRRFRALQTEASVKPIYQGMPAYHEVIQDIERLGFELSGVFPNNAHHFPAMIEFDCHMIAREFVEY